MKGFAFSTFIFVVLTLIIVMGFLLPSLITSRARAIETSAALNAEEIVGIINLLQTSPQGTMHQYYLPKTECEIKINNNIVTVSIKSGRKESYSLGHIQHVDVAESTEECDPKKDKVIYFARCEKTVVMANFTNPC